MRDPASWIAHYATPPLATRIVDYLRTEDICKYGPGIEGLKPVAITLRRDGVVGVTKWHLLGATSCMGLGLISWCDG
jgi:hypothetical protein